MDLSQTKLADLGTMSGIGVAAAQAAELPAGKVIADRFEIVRVIGQGGMGVVYEAHDQIRQQNVALKFLRPELVSSDTAKQRFLNEARITIALSNDHIVSVYDVARFEDSYFLTMELLQGKSLRQLLQEQAEAKQQMPIAQALGIAKDVAQGLAYAHKSTIHRDIKPENIWIESDGKAKLMDFGIARLQTQTQGLTKTAAVLGTAYYMAPEQIVGSGQIDHRADQYSLGVVLYEMLTGTLPIGRGGVASSKRQGLDKKFDLVIEKMMAGSVGERYAEDASLQQALNTLPSAPVQPLFTRQKVPNIEGISQKLIYPIVGLAVTLFIGFGVTQRQTLSEKLGEVFKDCATCAEMVIIPAGSFTMGNASSGNNGEKPAHEVTLPNFAIGKTEVTQGQWKAVMGNNPSSFKSCGDDCPVEQVSWDDTQAFIQKLNQQTGKGYRLPSEAEWEYAGLARSTTDYSYGNSSTQLGDYGWFQGNSGNKTNRVGQKKPNAFGLYDMHGNVQEWTQDCYNSSYKDAPANAQAWITGDCSRRMVRGGGWLHYPIYLVTSTRTQLIAADRSDYVGFRLARALP